MLICISGLVLVALRLGDRPELFNVDHKPITDGLSKLPATYDGVRADKKGDETKLPSAVPKRSVGRLDGLDDAEAVERARLARMAGQARESQVFFRIQAKAPPRSEVEAVQRPDPVLRPSPRNGDGDGTTLAVLRAAKRAQALETGDLDPTANDTTEQTRKLSFLESEPEKDVYNPHALQKPASPYQLMAGTIIAASMVSGDQLAAILAGTAAGAGSVGPSAAPASLPAEGEQGGQPTSEAPNAGDQSSTTSATLKVNGNNPAEWPLNQN